jgi:hypothetical protein
MIEYDPILLKLTSGETVIGHVDNHSNIYDRRFVTIKNPAILNHVRIPKGNFLLESYILLPWCSFSSEEYFNIPTSQIITAAKVKEELKNNYIDFIMRKNDKSSSEEETVLDFDEDDGMEEFMNTLEGRLEDDETGEEENEDDRTTRRRGTGSTKILH